MKTDGVINTLLFSTHDLNSNQKIPFGFFNPFTRQWIHT